MTEYVVFVVMLIAWAAVATVLVAFKDEKIRELEDKLQKEYDKNGYLEVAVEMLEDRYDCKVVSELKADRYCYGRIIRVLDVKENQK